MKAPFRIIMSLCMYPTFSSDVWSEENVETLFGFHHFHVIINDPKEDMIGIFMTQLQPAIDKSLHRKFRVLAYQAIVD